MCSKKENRNLNTLFHLFSCDGCNKIYRDEQISIGKTSVFIYYTIKCPYSIDDFSFNRKVMQLLFEFIKAKSEEILLLEEFKAINKEDLEVLLLMETNIHIIN